ncbi:MAG: hypothetical protein H6742_00715 [Alphaproteobacteria bacterium]|nr:hypothetical protein [Alphaproteobacteria bacterium]
MKRTLSILLLSSATLFACGDKDGTGDTGTGSTGGDTGTTGGDGPCGPWSSFDRPDAEWGYSLDETWAEANKKSGSFELSAFGQETWDSIYVYLIKEKGDYVVPGWDRHETAISYRYVCDTEGIKLLQFEGTYKYEDELTTDGGWWAGEFDEPVMVQPHDIAVGDHWEFSTTYSYTSNATGGTGMPLSATYDVVDELAVDTPAGSFTALAIDVEWSGDARTEFQADSYTLYVAQDVGMVGMADRAWLTNYDLNPEFEY